MTLKRNHWYKILYKDYVNMGYICRVKYQRKKVEKGFIVLNSDCIYRIHDFKKMNKFPLWFKLSEVDIIETNLKKEKLERL